MKKKIIFTAIFIIVFAVLFFVFGIKYLGNMTEEKIQSLVERDTIVFNSDEISGGVLDKLADYKVVVMGEYHNIVEHKELKAQMAIGFNKKFGCKNFLVEAPQAFSWIYEDYSMGLITEINEENSRRFWLHTGEIEKIRNHNLSQPLDKRIKVSTIDINHSPYSYVMSIEYMLEYVDESSYLQDYFTDLKKVIRNDEDYIDRVVKFRDDITLNKDMYIAELGEVWYDRLAYMTDIEIKSFAIRNSSNHIFIWKRDKLREALICNMVDSHIESAEGKVLINIGANHAQKKPVRGTKMQWLGEYLSKESPYAKDQTYCMVVVPAEGTVEGLKGNISLFEGAHKNELFRIIAEHSSGARGFLSFDDEILNEEKVLMNFHYDMQSLPPMYLYDGVIVLPKSTYVDPFPND